MRAQPPGFTLIELAVVLVILSVLLAFGVSMGQNVVRNSERLSTLERMALIKQSLDAYAARNGYLPCPADPALTPAGTNYGFESRDTATPYGCVATGQVFQNSSVWYGTLPVKNLGLDENFIGDAWGSKLTYAVSANHIGGSTSHFNSYAANTGTVEIRSGTIASSRIITTLPTGEPGASATYAVISHGKNKRGAYPVAGSSIASACATAGGEIDGQNCDRNNAVFFDAEYNEGTQITTQFDDYIVWGSNALLRNPAAVLPNGCPAGVCEAWCAPCETDGTSTPPTTPTRICAKFIVSGLPSCSARCIWPTATTPCP